MAVFVFPGLYASIAHASAAEDLIGAEALAMASTAVAAPDDNSAITVNPAAIALAERYDFHGMFRYGPSSGLHWGGNVVDSRTSKHVALGLSYSADRFEGPLVPGETPGWVVPGQELDNTKRTNDFALALAAPLLNRKLSVGINGAVSIYNHDRLGNGVQFNADVGLAARPVDWLVIGAAARNVLPLEGLGDRQLGGLGGIRLHGEGVGAFEVDVGWTDLRAGDPWMYAIGAEKNFGEVALLRAGFRKDGPLERRDVTFGVGLTNGGATLSYGLAVPIGMGANGAGANTLAGVMNQLSLTFDAPDPDTIEPPF